MYSASMGQQSQPQGSVVTSRQEVIRMLQQKGANPQQIDLYLQQKGL